MKKFFLDKTWFLIKRGEKMTKLNDERKHILDYKLKRAKGQRKVVLHEQSLGRDYNGE